MVKYTNVYSNVNICKIADFGIWVRAAQIYTKEVESSVSFYQYIRLRCEVRNGNVLNVEYKCHTVLG